MSEKQDSVVTNFSMLILLMTAMTVGLILLGTIISKITDTGPDPMEVAAADARIEPVGRVALTDGTLFIAGSMATQAKPVEPEPEVEVAAAPVVMDGEGVYNTACTTCHATGLAGAPKYGVAADWEARLAQGIEVLYDHSLNGFQAMPAKGGFAHLPDDQIKLAVDYMVTAAK